MTARTRFIAPALVGGFVILAAAALGGWIVLRSDNVPPCESPQAELATAVDAAGLDWQLLSGETPTNPVTWLSGEVPDSYPSEICEKAFFDSPDGADAVNNVSLHRYPSSDVARAEFPSFFQDAIEYGDELAPGHRYQPADPSRSAHLIPGSCLVVAVTWEADNRWGPEQRHASVLDVFEPVRSAACPPSGP